jgi:TorA maturation chaperone TorD
MSTVNTAQEAPNAIQEQVAYADTCRLLALFLQIPNQELFSGLGSSRVRDDMEAIFFELGWERQEFQPILEVFNRIAADIQEGKDTLSELRSEYTRLFNHPKKPVVLLYEGAFLEGEAPSKVSPPHVSKNKAIAPKFQKELGKLEASSLLFVNRAALDAERCYRQAGLKRAADMNVPADCMYTEMAFMDFLHTQKAKALLEDDQTRITEIDAHLAEFTHLHLKKWAKVFFRKCQDESRHKLYQATGTLGGLLMDKVLMQQS